MRLSETFRGVCFGMKTYKLTDWSVPFNPKARYLRPCRQHIYRYSIYDNIYSTVRPLINIFFSGEHFSPFFTFVFKTSQTCTCFSCNNKFYSNSNDLLKKKEFYWFMFIHNIHFMRSNMVYLCHSHCLKAIHII